MDGEISRNYGAVRERIQAAAERCGRDPNTIRLIAVTKSVSADRVREAVDCGVSDIGENRVQEAIAKQQDLRGLPLTWHFIGHLQTNKAPRAAGAFDYIHSVDRIGLAEKLNTCTRPLLPVLVEVNLGSEVTKPGVREPQLAELIEVLRGLNHLDLRGLMAVPPYSEDSQAARGYFRRLRVLAAQFELKELSMGMSSDFEVAIEEGATMVRVGTALFGARR